MHFQTAFLLLVPFIVANIVLADMPKDDAPRPAVQIRTRRSVYVAMMDGIGVTKEAMRYACRGWQTSFCTKFGTTLAVERTRRDTNAEMMGTKMTANAEREAKKEMNGEMGAKKEMNAEMMNTKKDTNAEVMGTKTNANPERDTKMDAVVMNTKTNANPERDTKTETNAVMVNTKTDSANPERDTKTDAVMVNTKTNVNPERDTKMDTTNAEVMDTKKEANAAAAAPVAASDNTAPAPMTWMMDGIVPRDVNVMVDRTTKELRKTTETDGFYDMSQRAQERVMLETAGKQGEIVKTKLKEAIEEARKMIERALGTVISYSEAPMESKMQLEQVFMTLTDETKTPKEKMERIKDIQQKWTPEIRAALKPSTDDKEIAEAIRFFTDLPAQIELGKK
uniref:Hypothetical esophageal gland cell secretory protein 4 n=1 Tax=Heterodera glycines TaxID=51029 RepID=Q9BN20_HETGL|nr:hypothetical esophageal gland cell secretory protein 4 [Heterodera glycines]